MENTLQKERLNSIQEVNMLLESHFPPPGMNSFRLAPDPLHEVLTSNRYWPRNSYILGLSRGESGFDLPEEYGGKRTSIYRDADFSLIIIKKFLYFFTIPLACISFDEGIDEKTGGTYLLVKQIQGVRRKQRRLRKIKWERALLSAVIALGRHCSFQEIRVQKSEHNRWLTSTRKDRFRMRYDILPRRMGFRTESADQRAWVLKLDA